MGLGFRKDGLRAAALLLATLLATGPACKSIKESAGLAVVPKSLRDVPAERLAFRFEPDAAEERLPERLRHDEPEEPAAAIRTAFETERPSDALIRTVVDPSGMRALALYGTSETDTDFRIDLYNTGGQFIRNVLPPDLTGVFPAEVAWSPDGSYILFSGVRTPTPQATPQDTAPAPPGLSPSPVGTPGALPEPTAAPLIPSTQTFRTEQVYVGDRDGYNLRPLTAREGLIYFKLAWSPDGRQVAALACKEDEWEAQRREGNPHAGRPRLLTLEGQERLLDDRETPVEPAWSPDGSKLATAFEYDMAVYDASGGAPTGAGLSLREPLRASSADYDARVFKKAEPKVTPKGADEPQPQPPRPPGEALLISLNPFVRLEWVEPETIYAQTAFVHIYKSGPEFRYPRWHVIHVSAQAAVLGRLRPRTDERSAPLSWTSKASPKSSNTSTARARGSTRPSRA
ncbi:MAG: PD40 domain-containing protein [Acidobacteria bacterium]|nr:PD40 domain-containing protein [Acidobacteriota bacterium]